LENAVVDRIVDKKHAVLLVGENEVEKIVPLEKLPAGTVGGTWLQVNFEEGKFVNAKIDAEETARTKARITAKVGRLRQRGRKTGK